MTTPTTILLVVFVVVAISTAFAVGKIGSTPGIKGLARTIVTLMAQEPSPIESAAALEAASGRRPMLVSGVSGEGVTALLRAAWTEVRKDRGEIAPAETDETVMETPGGWEP